MRKLKKPVSILLSLILVFSLFSIVPFEVGAETTSVTYIDRSWDEETKTVTETVKTLEKPPVFEQDHYTGDVTVGDGWLFVDRNITIDQTMYINDGYHVKLIIANGCTLTVKGGIYVRESATFSVYGQQGDTGKLHATNEYDENLYSGVDGDDSAHFNIYGATIEAIGDNRLSAGISGNVTIYGGTVNATAGSTYGAGIGGSSHDSGENITINGGEVTAIGGSDASGIGGGYEGNGGNITINGGTVKAYGGAGAAGIGGGHGGSGGTITINGGEIIAHSTSEYEGIGNGDGAGIGGGIDGNGGNITINGGTVEAISYADGAGIGGGDTSEGIGGHGGDGGNITIRGGKVTAISVEGGAGIGGGYHGNGGTINIYDGEINARCNGKDWGDGAGIGGGDGGDGGTVHIYGGKITAYADGESNEGSAIGGGLDGADGTLTIADGLWVHTGVKPDSTDWRYRQNRVSECRSSKYAYIEPCTRHTADPEPNDGNPVWSDYESDNETTHSKHCVACNVSKDTHNHDFDDPVWSWGDHYATAQATFKCKDCPYSETLDATVTREETPQHTIAAAAAVEFRGTTHTKEVTSDIPVYSYIRRSWNEETKRVEETTEYIYDFYVLETTNEKVWAANNRCEIGDDAHENTNGWYVVNSDVTLKGFISKGDNVNLLICDGAKLTCNEGLTCDVSIGGDIYHLNIFSQQNGTGEIVATGADNNAGIGGLDETSAGVITIHGGKITATGGDNSAGIGGGYGGNGGTVTIYGGNITATGEDNGAGIGGGYHGKGGTVSIYGGTVNAKSKNDGAGIGGGDCGKGGTVNIYGGNVTAEGEESAGIGGGYHGDGGAVNIYGGNVNAYGGENAAGIGGGDGGDGGTININGGYVTALGGDEGACIGSGNGASFGGNITITDGEVVAVGFLGYVNDQNDNDGDNGLGAGIGGGDGSSSGNITISGGKVRAKGLRSGAGIGGGENGGVDSIIISGGTVEAQGGEGAAAIGSGEQQEMAGTIEISGGDVKAISNTYLSYTWGTASEQVGAAIGAGDDGDLTGTIKLIGGHTDAEINHGDISNSDRKRIPVIGAGLDGSVKDTASIILGDDMSVYEKDNEERIYRENRYKYVTEKTYHLVIESCSQSNAVYTVDDDHPENHIRNCAYCLNHDSIPHTYECRWTWDGYSSATASLFCPDCYDKFTATATGGDITSEITTEPSTTASGVRTYTAKVTRYGVDYTGTKTERISLTTDVEYKDTDGSIKTKTAKAVYSDDTALSTGWYAVMSSFTTNNRISCNGNVNLILCDDCSLEATRGISVNSGSSLTIWGQENESGVLTARVNKKEYQRNAGIGGDEGSSGAITINGGKVNASGGEYCAGIGGSHISSADITINGGTVTAQGGLSAAGIGCGSFRGGGVAKVTINGGTITAAGGNYGAAIGGGRLSRGVVTINGGDVTANKGGIGSGWQLDDNDSAVGSVTLNYGDAGVSIKSNEYHRTNIIIQKPLTDGTDVYLPGTYEFTGSDLNVFAKKTVVPATVPEGSKCIEWRNYDGTLLLKKYLTPGELPVFSKDNPTRAADDFFVYNFSGWTPEVTEVTGDAVYTADYSINAKIYISDDISHGTVTADAADAAAGDTVTLTVTPDENCRLTDISAEMFIKPKAIDGTGTGNQGYDKLTDGNINKKWCTGFNGFAYNIFKTNEPVKMKGYGLTTADDTANFGGRNWKSWTIYGANFDSDDDAKLNSDAWNVITTVENDDQLEPVNFTRFDYMLSAPAASYQYYKIEVTQNVEDDCIQMAEFTLYPDHSDDAIELSGEGETRTFTMPEYPVIIKAAFEESDRFIHRSLSLNGDIGVNFYVRLSDEEKANSQVVFTWDGNSAKRKTFTVPFSEAKDTENGVRFTCPISAAEMNDTITAKLYVNGEFSASDVYSARQYAEFILNNAEWIAAYEEKEGVDKYNKLATLVKTMLNYGASAQVQFDHNTDDLANKGIDYPFDPLTGAELNAIPNIMPTKDSVDLSKYGLSYYGGSLLLKSKTTLRFYFEITDHEKYSAEDIRLGDITEVKPYKNGSKYVYIEAVGIAANDLDQTYALSVGDTTLGEYSVLSYVKDVLTDGDTDAPLTDTVTALYRYNEAAKAFFVTPLPGPDETDIKTGS